ncbi:MAG: hypothetical protein QM734_15965, partial [Cyclobacteriaceae bacterium]
MRKLLLLSSLLLCFAIGESSAQCSITTSAITGSVSVCANTNGVTYSVTNNSGSAYAWTITGGTPVATSTTNSISINWGAAGSGNVKVIETFSGGCVGNAVNLGVTVNALPTTSSIQGKTTYAPYMYTDYYVNPTTGSTYVWNATGGTPTTGSPNFTPVQNTPTGYRVTVSWSSLGNDNISVVETNSAGCVGSAVSLPVLIKNPVYGSAPSSTLMCIGSTMQCSPSSGGTWTTSTPSTASISSTGLVTALGYGTASFNFTDNSTGIVSGFNITITSPAAARIGGSTIVCANTTNSAYSFSYNSGASNRAGSTYQWTITGGTQQSGGTTSSITVNWGSGGAGNVSVVETVAEGCTGAVVNYPVTINPATTITAQPSISSQTVCQGTNPSALSVTATGTGTLSYQWYASDTAVPGTIGSSVGGTIYSVSSGPTLTPNMIGTYYYWAIVTSNTCVTPVYSNVSGAITINPTTAITTQPATNSVQFCQNTVATPLTVVVTGAGLTYQWYSNATNSNTGGVAVSGATSSSFTPPTSTPSTVYYYVAVNSPCGTVTSNVSGAVIISATTLFTAQPSTASQSVCVNANGSPLSVTATGANLSYSLYSNTSNSNTGGTLIASGTYLTSWTPSSYTPGTIYYYVVASGQCGTATSNPSGAINFTPITSITVQPSTTSQTVCQGSSISPLAVTATGTSPLNYQWYSNSYSSNTDGVAISGANSSTYTPSSATTGTAYYYAIVNGPCGSVTSSVSGAIAVTQKTVFAVQPSSSLQTICQSGATTQLSAVAIGTGTLSYQWYSNSSNNNTGGTLISGANSINYQPPSATTGTTYYYAVATSSCGTATSNVSGAVTINQSTTIATQPSGTSQNIPLGGSVTPLSVTASGAGSLSYQWYSNTANSNSSGS